MARKSTLPSELLKGRAYTEGNFVMALWKKPEDFYPDYKIEEGDLITTDGLFYYNLGLNMYRKGIKCFDEISVITFLKDYPELEKKFEDRGGYESIKEGMDVIKTENMDAYYEYLVKENVLLSLYNKGFDVVKDLDKFKDLTAQEINDYYTCILNSISLKTSHSLNLERLDLTDEEIMQNIEGSEMGYQFNKASPLLNKFCNGIPKIGLTMIGSYTNGGKTSFMFSNMVIPLIEQKIKVAYISNEQMAKNFKYLLLIYVLQSKLGYSKITRNKLSRMSSLSDDDMEMVNKAREIIKEHYSPYIYFYRAYDYSVTNIQMAIKKLANQGVRVFIYDTLKLGDSGDNSVWQQLYNVSKSLFQVSSEQEVAIITAVQLTISSKNHVRWLDESVLSNSKQIAEVYEEIFLFRDLWDDEYTNDINDVQAYNLKKDDKGFYTSEKDMIETKRDDNEKYKLFFHVKSRNNENGQVALYKFSPPWNTWREMGYAMPGSKGRWKE